MTPLPRWSRRWCRRRPGTVLLTANLLAALHTVRTQRVILRALKLAGPQTTRELVTHCARPGGWVEAQLGQAVYVDSVKRALRRLRRAGALVGHQLPRNQVLWALPGAPLPDRRQTPDRRAVVRQAVTEPVAHGSWWVQPSDEAFVAAVVSRWR